MAWRVLRRWIRQRGWGLAVGALLTLIVIELYVGGMLDWAVFKALDQHFRRFNRMPASDHIVMVDINDYAVERIHRWPWPRRLHAQLIATLTELGADAILMDMLFPEPMPPRFVHPGFGRDYAVDKPTEILGDVQDQNLVLDDEEFATALNASGRVYLALYYRGAPPNRPLEQIRTAAETLFGADPKASRDAFRAAMPVDLGDDLEDYYQRYRLRQPLVNDFTLDLDALTERVGAPEDEVERYLPEVKRLVARDIARRVLADQPDIDFRTFHAQVLPGEDFDNYTADREDMLRAYRTLRSYQQAIDDNPAVPASMHGRIEQGHDVTAPLDVLAAAARDVGFVTFEKDADGVMRRVPLVIDVESRIVKQIGFAVACDLLDIDDATIRMDGHSLRMESRDGATERSVPVADDGKTLLGWHYDATSGDWQQSFDHISVSEVMEIVFNRDAIEENETRIGVAAAEAVQLALAGAYAEYTQLIQRRNNARNVLRLVRGSGSPEEAAALATIDSDAARIAGAEQMAIAQLQSVMHVSVDDAELSPEERTYIETAHRLLTGDLSEERIQGIREINERLRARNEELLARLGSRIAGKAVFLGYTASAVADVVNTPVFENMPGVLAHANMLNCMLENRFPRAAPTWANVLLIGMAGLLVSVLTASLGPWVSLLSVALIILVLLGLSFVLFAGSVIYVASVVALLAVFLGWAFITLYRQLTEQRAKRQFSKALAQYTSPAVAAQIAEHEQATDLTPKPCDVTCFFSDLKGFTAISERLGAERTRAILNPYLEAMSAVLIAQRAIVNKFMGDGIFAFFNPPILPCTDHALAACEAAVDSLAALDRLRRDAALRAVSPQVEHLSMRIGINSGSVFVGDYGSVNKLDYTCIGDAVNLAARLEPANKFFGTRILVSGVSREAADGEMLFRPLGRLQVVGKEEAVPVYELVGRKRDVSDDDRTFVATFAGAIEQFQLRRWEDTDAVLAECVKARPEDQPSRVFRDLVASYRRQPPPDDWNLGIELTTK